jgi:hypothetical protein
MSTSDSGIPPRNNVQNPPPDPNRLLDDLILQRAREIGQNQRENNLQTTTPEVEIHDITSQQILSTEITPFSHEGELPHFEHGCIALHYFTNLRSTLDKCTRAQIQNTFIKECLSKRIIPKGFKINKAIMAVDPSPKLRLSHYQITTEAETLLMKAVIEHYTRAIPKLISEFTEYFEEITKMITPPDRRLLVLKLIHYKNDIIESRTKNQAQKMERPTNRYMDGGNSAARNNNVQPQDNYAPNRGGPQFRGNTGPQNRQPSNRDNSPEYRLQWNRSNPNYRGARNQRPAEQSWQRSRAPNAAMSNLQDEWEDFEVVDEEYPNDQRGGRYNQPPPKEQRQPRTRGNQRFKRGGGRF